MSMMNKITSFAKSRQGREWTQKATNYAKSPEAKQRIAQARERLASGKGSGKGVNR